MTSRQFPALDAIWRRLRRFVLPAAMFFALVCVCGAQTSTPEVIEAVKNGDTAAAVKLIEAGASLDVVDSLGMTPLMWAANLGDIEMVKLLLGKGADANAGDPAGWTPLIHAAAAGNTEVVNALLGGGASVYVVTGNGTTALMAASAHPATVQALLANGADPRAQAQDGMTALTAAKNAGSTEAVRLIEAAMLADGAPQPAAAEQQSPEPIAKTPEPAAPPDEAAPPKTELLTQVTPPAEQTQRVGVLPPQVPTQPPEAIANSQQPVAEAAPAPAEEKPAAIITVDGGATFGSPVAETTPEVPAPDAMPQEATPDVELQAPPFGATAPEPASLEEPPSAGQQSGAAQIAQADHDLSAREQETIALIIPDEPRFTEPAPGPTPVPESSEPAFEAFAPRSEESKAVQAEDAAPERIFLQLGSFHSAAEADERAAHLRSRGHAIAVHQRGQQYLLLAGPYPDQYSALSHRTKLQRDGFESFIARLSEPVAGIVPVTATIANAPGRRNARTPAVIEEPRPVPQRRSSSRSSGEQVFLQLAAFRTEEGAMSFANELTDPRYQPIVQYADDGWFRVVFGPFGNRDAALAYREQLAAQGRDSVLRIL